MAENSKISWCDDTANGWIGCNEVRLVLPDGTHVPSECDNCYARILAYNRMGYNGHDSTHPVLWGNPKLTPRHRTKYVAGLLPKLDAQARAHGRRLVFAFSLSDVFEDHPQLGPWRAEFFDLVERTWFLDYLMLTKRPQNVLHMTPPTWRQRWPQNVWIGTSAGTQAAMDRRAPHLGDIRAAGAPVAFLSMEPLLDLTDPIEAIEKHGVNWIITGGESGTGVDRPRIDADLDWYRLARDVAVKYGVAFFHKQGSGPRPGTNPELDGRLWHQWPDTGLGLVGGVRAMPGAELIRLPTAVPA